MAIPLSELHSILGPIGISSLRSSTTNTASGKAQVHYAVVEVRLLSRNEEKEVMPWRTVRCRGYPRIARRIFRGTLENECFVCSHPEQCLYIAYSKRLLFHRMPR